MSLILVIPLLWMACDNSQSSQQPVTGTYAGEWTNNFGKVTETFSIKQDSVSTGYLIIRETTHFRELQGKPADTTHKRVRYAGTFDATSNTMQLDDPSIVLTFTPNADTVKITGSETPYSRK